VNNNKKRTEAAKERNTDEKKADRSISSRLTANLTVILLCFSVFRVFLAPALAKHTLKHANKHMSENVRGRRRRRREGMKGRSEMVERTGSGTCEWTMRGLSLLGEQSVAIRCLLGVLIDQSNACCAVCGVLVSVADP